MTRYHETRIWDYFEGGLPGVKRRVCERVANTLAEVAEVLQENKSDNAEESYAEAEKNVGLPRGILAKIRRNEELNGEFTSSAVQRLAACCRFDLVECFCVRPLSNDERTAIISAADEEQFFAFAATGDPEWSQDGRIELFLLTTALRQLDNPENG